jgi:protein TonB
VLVEFTVTVTGAVRNVVVIESTDSVFERAAVQAALRFKYRPRVVDGVAVEVTGVQHYIRFEIEE